MLCIVAMLFMFVATQCERPFIMTNMNNMATMQSIQGKEEHPGTLASMNNLAMVPRIQGKYQQAKEMHRQALGLREVVPWLAVLGGRLAMRASRATKAGIR